MQQTRDQRPGSGMNDATTGTGAAGTAPRTRGRALAALGWTLLIALGWSLDTLVKWQERERSGTGLDDFRLLTEQGTSALAVLLLVPAVYYWVGRFPLSGNAIGRWLPAHLAGSVLFSLAHLSLMVLMRSTVFAAQGMAYHWRAGFLGNLVFEYQKDVLIYGLIVAVIGVSHALRRRTGKTGEPPEARLLVQSGTGEVSLPLAQVDYLEAARNYVSVYAGDREYLLRETMNALEERLAGQGFARCHRSYMVRLAAVAELAGGAAGGGIRLHSGVDVPLGRSYRDGFRRLYAGSRVG